MDHQLIPPTVAAFIVSQDLENRINGAETYGDADDTLLKMAKSFLQADSDSQKTPVCCFLG